MDLFDIADNILKVLASAALKGKEAPADLAEWRMRECKKCPMLSPRAKRCGHCGCYMEIKVTCLTNFNPKKAREEVTHCPEGLWNDKDTANYYRAMDGLEPL